MSLHSHFQDIILTNAQQQALEKLNTFFTGSDKVFLLKGYAGTGKTTLLKGVANYLQAEKRNCSLMAPTGRAAMVLRNKTGVEATTIHKAIYNFSKIEEKQEGSSFKFFFGLSQNEDPTNSIYFVDEASMISDCDNDDEFIRFGSGFILRDLFEFAFAGENNRKIVFIGDDAQLPPVGMNFSPGLKSYYLRSTYAHEVKEFKLTEVVRQGTDSGILKAATNIRNSIAKDEFNSFEISANHHDILESSPIDFISNYYSTAREHGVRNSIVITHSNKQALDYNEQIRKRRFGDKSSKLQIEDLLIITHNNYNYPVELYNGMFARVTSVGDVAYTAQPKFYIDKKKTVARELIFRDVQVEVQDIFGIKHILKTTVLDNFLTDQSGKLHPYDQRALYIDFKDRMAKLGVKPRDEEFKKSIKNDIYFNALQAKYGYAITCHKSQGGEWDTVFVDFQVFMGKMTKSYFRWVYTAITRSSTKLFCIAAPSFNAFNQFVVKDTLRITNVMPGTFYFPLKDGEPLFFVEYRLGKIQSIASEKSYDLVVKRANNQLDLTFQKEGKSARTQLWYANHGFSRTTWVNCSDEEFKVLIKEILSESILPEKIDFQPKFEFQKGLHDYLMEILSIDNIRLTNIVQKDWSDQYFIQSDAECSMIEFFYTKKHIYTNALPKSTSGKDDIQLMTIVNQLSGSNQ
jgi:tRNA A37 threonylcarbamoyladenosine biosynthesis protein TsaE